VTPLRFFSFFEYFFNYPAAVSLLLAAQKMLAKSGMRGLLVYCADNRGSKIFLLPGAKPNHRHALLLCQRSGRPSDGSAKCGHELSASNKG
jgi:hypothetical protein